MGQWDIVIKSIKDSDVVLEVIDARVARETRSLKLEELVLKFGKKLIVVINKADLVPQEFEAKLRADLKKQHDVVSVSSKGRKGTGYLKGAIRRHNPKTVCVIGYPNTGKSSVINMLSHSGSARTSPVCGYTRSAQWIRLAKGIKLMDTPGVLPQDEKFGVFTSSLRPEKTKAPSVAALELLEKIKQAEGTNINEIYKIPLDVPEKFLDEFARKRNYLIKGGVDTERASRQIIADWNCGKLSGWWY